MKHLLRALCLCVINSMIILPAAAAPACGEVQSKLKISPEPGVNLLGIGELQAGDHITYESPCPKTSILIAEVKWCKILWPPPGEYYVVGWYKWQLPPSFIPEDLRDTFDGIKKYVKLDQEEEQPLKKLAPEPCVSSDAKLVREPPVRRPPPTQSDEGP